MRAREVLEAGRLKRWPQRGAGTLQVACMIDKSTTSRRAAGGGGGGGGGASGSAVL